MIDQNLNAFLIQQDIDRIGPHTSPAQIIIVHERVTAYMHQAIMLRKALRDRIGERIECSGPIDLPVHVMEAIMGSEPTVKKKVKKKAVPPQLKGGM